jgi:hypothetical protein
MSIDIDLALGMFTVGFLFGVAFWRLMTGMQRATHKKSVDTQYLMTSAVENAINWGRSHLGSDAMKLLPAEKIAEQWWKSGEVRK